MYFLRGHCVHDFKKLGHHVIVFSRALVFNGTDFKNAYPVRGSPDLSGLVVGYYSSSIYALLQAPLALRNIGREREIQLE
jgi:hypothetical protein